MLRLSGRRSAEREPTHSGFILLQEQMVYQRMDSTGAHCAFDCGFLCAPVAEDWRQNYSSITHLQYYRHTKQILTRRRHRPSKCCTTDVLGFRQTDYQDRRYCLLLTGYIPYPHAFVIWRTHERIRSAPGRDHESLR